MSSFQKMVTIFVLYTIFTTYSVNITGFNSHSVTSTETHNICIVIAIWAPIMLVSLVGLVPLLWLSHFCAFSSFHSYDLSIYRFILWMLKFGMLFMPLYLVALLEPSAIWERLVTCLLQYFILSLRNFLFCYDLFFNSSWKKEFHYLILSYLIKLIFPWFFFLKRFEFLPEIIIVLNSYWYIILFWLWCTDTSKLVPYTCQITICVIQLPLYQSMIALSSNGIHFFFG